MLIYQRPWTRQSQISTAADRRLVCAVNPAASLVRLTTQPSRRATDMGVAYEVGAATVPITLEAQIVLPNSTDFVLIAVLPQVELAGTNPGIIRSDPNSDGTSFAAFDGGTGYTPWLRLFGVDILHPSSGAGLVAGQSYAVAFRFINAVSASVFWNGQKRHEVTTTHNNSSASFYNLGYQFSQAERVGNVAGFFWANKSMSDQELCGLTLNPWKLFAPLPRRLWVPQTVPPAPLYGTLGQFDPELRLAAWF